jgi:hypothetical protein
VGGDAWEERGGGNRFISIVMPLFFILFSCALSQLIQNRRAVLLAGVVSILSFNSAALGEFFLVGKIFQVDFNENLVNYSEVVKAFTTPDASIALTSVGIVPYFSERKAIDELGKCDRVIAHKKSFVRYDYTSIINYKPGHMKYDHDYILGTLKPDFISQFPGLEREKVWKYINSDYYKLTLKENNLILYFRKDSKNIRWELLNRPDNTEE